MSELVEKGTRQGVVQKATKQQCFKIGLMGSYKFKDGQSTSGPLNPRILYLISIIHRSGGAGFTFHSSYFGALKNLIFTGQ